MNKTPLPALLPNDVVTAGDFPIVVQHVSGGNGTFSGDGFVTLPFINKFRKAIGGTFDANSDQNVGIKITFDNIGVNTDFKLISGEIVASYDADKWNKMLDADKLVEDVKKLADEIRKFLLNYKGTDKDKAQAAEFHKKQDQWSANLIADTNLSQEEKTKIIENQKNAQDSWKGLENANACISNKNTNNKKEKGGPHELYIEEPDFECHKAAVENQAKANEEADNKINFLGLDGKLTPPIEATNTGGQIQKVPKITVALLNDIRLHCTVNDGLSVKIGMTKAQTKAGEFYSFCKANNGTFYYYQGDEYWYIQGKWYVETLCGQEYCIKVCTKNNNDGTGVYEKIEMEQGESTIVQTLNFVNKTCLIDIPLLIVGGASTKIPVVVFNTISTITIEVLNRSEVLSDREALVSQVAAILVTHQLSSETPAATTKLAEKLIEKIKNGWKLSGKSKEELVVEVEKALGKTGKITRESWNGFNNIFKATTDEIAEASSKIRNYRLTAPKGGNFGYIEGKVEDITVDGKFWRSGPANIKTEPQIFTALEVEGVNGGTWLRNTDSEYKMLNKLADDLGAVKNMKYPNIKGELKIISENPYCASCTGIIQEFNEMYPNIKLILIDGAK